MKYGKMPPKSVLSDNIGYPIYSGYRVSGYAKEYLYKDPMLILVARGVGGTGDVKISPAEAWITNLSIVLELIEGFDKKYIFYLLNLEELKSRLNTGAAQAQITIANLGPYRIKTHDYATQLKIVSIISAYDDLIENNRRRIALLEEAARQLYKEWFVHFRFPGHEHVKINDGVPEGWEPTTLGAVVTTNDQSYSAKNLPDHLRYIDISAVSKGEITINSPIASDEAPGRARRIAKHGDVIWSNVRPNLRAYALVMHPDEIDVFSTGFTILSSSIFPFSFLYLYTTTDAFVNFLVNHATGASYPAVRSDDFKRADVVVPPSHLLKAFHDLCEPNFEMVAVLRQQNGQLATARDLILPRLMSGAISI